MIHYLLPEKFPFFWPRTSADGFVQVSICLVRLFLTTGSLLINCRWALRPARCLISMSEKLFPIVWYFNYFGHWWNIRTWTDGDGGENMTTTNGIQQISSTRPKLAYGRQGLDWIFGPGYSFVVFSTNKTMETHQKPWKTMKPPWKTMETNQKPWNTMKPPWKTMETNQKPWKTKKPPWKTMETNQKPWKQWNHLEKPWKPTKNHEKP